jgi:polyisoprenoid-binding protein YceI
VPVDKAAQKIYASRHETIGWLILIAVCLHIGAALKHYIIDKDRVLQRMLPAVAFMAFLLAAAPASAAVPHWTLVHEKSSITFRPRQMGTEFKGTFGVFSADIFFSPADLKDSKASIDVQIGTAHTGAPDRDENLKGKELFDVAQFPDAKFETKSIEKTGPDAYKAEGVLTIRNIALPVTLPFKLVITEEKNGQMATMDGTVMLDRSKFQIGAGQWADTSIIANEVPVDIHVVAVNLTAGQTGK